MTEEDKSLRDINLQLKGHETKNIPIPKIVDIPKTSGPVPIPQEQKQRPYRPYVKASFFEESENRQQKFLFTAFLNSMPQHKEFFSINGTTYQVAGIMRQIVMNDNGTFGKEISAKILIEKPGSVWYPPDSKSR